MTTMRGSRIQPFRAHGSFSGPAGRRFAILMAVIAASGAGLEAGAQIRYVVRFAIEKDRFVVGEPVFCRFTVENTGSKTFRFSYRFPTRVVHADLESEPDFALMDERGGKVPDPMPRPCGGGKGSVVYGSVTLPPGQAHSERWLLNQWARLTRPGRFEVRARRRLALLPVEGEGDEGAAKPLAFALAVNELKFELESGAEDQVRDLLAPFVLRARERKGPELAEAVLVLATLPRPYFLETLAALAAAPAEERRWERQIALEGLARLGTPEAWQVVEELARGLKPSLRGADSSTPDKISRSLAIQFLAQKGDAAFLPTLLEIAHTAPDELRGETIRALGQFEHPRASQALFDFLRSPRASERSNAVLGLRNLGVRDVVPALLAMLNDSDAQVRQVAHFALRSLTGQRFELSSSAGKAETAGVADQWRTWWKDHAAKFTPVRSPPCRDW